MATNTDRPRRFDLRETIPLATETLVRLAKKPKRSWLVPALTLFTGVALAAVMLELIFAPGSASALGFRGELRSRLLADYAEDPIAARIHELRLTIVEDVLGLDEGDSSGPSPIVMLLKDPVPTATPKADSPTSPVKDPTASPVPTDDAVAIPSETPSPAPSNTPPPPTAAAVAGYCDKLSITSMKVDGDDVEAKVRNSGSKDVYLIKTVFEWPDVPDPAYVDYFELKGIKGDDKYYKSDDWSSPTISTISADDDAKLRKGKTEDWKVDFDDEPGGKIYGSFYLTLTFDVPGQETHCSLSRSTFKTPPAPTDTPEPSPTDTPVPTETPEASATPDATATPAATDTPEPPTPETPTPTPVV